MGHLNLSVDFLSVFLLTPNVYLINSNLRYLQVNLHNFTTPDCAVGFMSVPLLSPDLTRSRLHVETPPVRSSYVPVHSTSNRFLTEFITVHLTFTSLLSFPDSTPVTLLNSNSKTSTSHSR